jgi:hypothetical protein
MAGPGNILIKVGAEAGQAIRELGSVDKALGDTMGTHQKMAAGLQKAALPAAAALGAIAVASVDAAKAAAEDAAARDKMIGVIERVTGATEAQAAAVDDWIGKLSLATGVADDELRPAMSRLAASTGDTAEAQKALQIAMDVSAATGKDLGTVADAIGKAYDGSTGGLQRLGVGLDSATLKSKDMTKIMAELADMTGGAMARQADTATGQYAIFTNQMNELKESLGAGLLPVVQALLPMLNQFAQFAAKNTTAIKLLVGVVAALSAGILVANAAMKAYAAAQTIVKVATAAWTAAQWLLNAALSANPIGLVIVAVAALAAGLVIAYKHSETFRNIVNAAFQAVLAAARSLAAGFQSLLGAARSAFDWIVAHWKVGLFAFGPIGAAVYVIIDNFNTLKSVALAAFDAIRGGISGLVGAIESVISAVQRLIDALGRIHVPHINLPGPLAVPAPLPPLRARGLAGAYGYAGARTAGGVTVNVYGAIDPEGTARTIRRILGDSARRSGR